MSQSAIKRTSAFTLVELLVVMLLIVVLAGIVLKAIRGLEERAKVQQAKADVALLVAALERYRVDHGHYPGGSGYQSVNHGDYINGWGMGGGGPSVLYAYLDADCTARKDKRSYINNWPKNRIGAGVYLDPWGRPYQYTFPDDRGSYLANAGQQGVFWYVYSAGPDGVYNPSYGGAGTDDIIGKVGPGFAAGAETIGH
jgi:general secretion pathway protein G